MSKNERIEKLEYQMRNLQRSLITTGVLKDGLTFSNYVRPNIDVEKLSIHFNDLLNYLKLEIKSEPATPAKELLVKKK